MNLVLSNRDEDLLDALSLKTRLFSLQQIAGHWWQGQVANARRRMKQLGEEDLIERIEVSARTLPELTAPVIAWRPGMDEPDVEAASYRLQRRWQSLAVRRCTAYIATEHAARIYGGKNRGELKRPLQATHDLGVSQVWLQLCRTAPQWAQAWRGEDFMASTRQGQKCPDSFIVDDAGEVVCVVEFGGEYRSERVQAFHADCHSRNLAYQIW